MLFPAALAIAALVAPVHGAVEDMIEKVGYRKSNVGLSASGYY